MVRIGSLEYSNTQMGEFLDAHTASDIHLSLWDRFKDLFRSQTKRAEVLRIFGALSQNTGAAGVQRKLARFNELVGYLSDSDRSKLTLECGPLQTAPPGARWNLECLIAGELIGKETVEIGSPEDASGLQAYHAAALCGGLRRLNEHLRSHYLNMDLACLIPDLESLLEQIAATPPLSSLELRSRHIDVLARIDLYRVKMAPQEASALERELESFTAPVSERLAASLTDLPASGIRKNPVLRIEEQEVATSCLRRALARLEDRAATGEVEETFAKEFSRDHHVTDSGRFYLGEEPKSPGTAKKLLAGTHALCEQALEQVKDFALQNTAQQRLIMTLFVQDADIAFRELCEEVLAGQPVRPQDRLSIIPGEWSSAKPQVQVTRRSNIWQAQARFSFEGSLRTVRLTDEKGKTQDIKLQPSSTLRLELLVVIEDGKFKEARGTVAAHPTV